MTGLVHRRTVLTQPLSPIGDTEEARSSVPCWVNHAHSSPSSCREIEPWSQIVVDKSSSVLVNHRLSPIGDTFV